MKEWPGFAPACVGFALDEAGASQYHEHMSGMKRSNHILYL